MDDEPYRRPSPVTNLTPRSGGNPTKWKLDYFATSHGDLEVVADDGTREKLKCTMAEYVANLEAGLLQAESSWPHAPIA